jgi:hypothetical protein
VQATARPAPEVVLAATGVLGWRLGLPAGASETTELRTGSVAAVGTVPRPSPAARPPVQWADAALDADDPRTGALLGAALDDLQGLLLGDPRHPADVQVAAGAARRLPACWTGRRPNIWVGC